MKRNLAFTLIEVMIVIVVIAVLAVIMLPVLAQAKRQGERPGQVSALHQTGLALALYAEDNGGEPNWPLLATARTVFSPSMTCDPLDDWRSNCKQIWDPLLGSFGYAIDDESDRQFFGGLYGTFGSVILLVSIFDPGPHPNAFVGDQPTAAMMSDQTHNYRMPAFATLVRSDLSVSRVPLAKANLSPQSFMAWRFLIIGVNVARL